MTADRTRNALINRISAVGLCVHEAALFLDTHPTDRDALRVFPYAEKRAVRSCKRI